ncbi:unnamed protein product [Trifolium pratense]|uniref:Uncharacterized protein n=1 Tax=Trifolium pratense TaxID=57577 RepID=A0ACB0M0M4_TRIPR|nr:unnamed protein product [Trifolium pratense]
MPQQIIKLMDVTGLKTAHIASHLQKFRLHLNSSSKKSKSGRVNSKQDQYHVPNEVVESMPEQDQKCDSNFLHAQQHPTVFDDFSSFQHDAR